MISTITKLKPRRIEAPEYPVSLDEIKAHLRIEIDDEDDLLLIYLAAAVSRLDGPNGLTGHALMTQKWEQSFSGFPSSGSRIRLDVGPVQSVESIDYYDENGDPQTIDPAGYAVFMDDDGSFVQLLNGSTWPKTSTRNDAVTITYLAGLSDTGDDLPAEIKQAILLLVGHFYENREPTAGAAMSGLSFELPLAVNWLLSSYREYCL